MSKLVLAFITLLLLPLRAFALPVGNPWDASLLTNGVFFYDGCADICAPCCWRFFNVRLGFYGDYVFDRKLETDSRLREGNIRETRIYTNAGYIALNICNVVDLYGTIGASNLEFITPQVTWEPSAGENRPYYLDTSSDISYTAGIRVTIFEFGCLGIGADGKYFYTCPRLNSGRREGASPDYFTQHMKYEEWQASLGISYLVPISCSIEVVPYAAVQWAQANADFNNLALGDLLFVNLEEQIEVGYSLGLTMVGYGKWSATIEGRFINEFAFHLNVQFRL